MTNYSLSIGIDPVGIANLASAGENIVIVKESPAPGSTYVAWVVCPAANIITVDWTENYQVYASTTQIQNGATITASSFTPASAGYLYTLTTAGFDDGQSILGPTQIGAKDENPNFLINSRKEMTTGLLQSATVNGGAMSNPLNAVTALFNQSAVFEPIEKIYVFPAAQVDNAAVLSTITGNACLVDLTTNPSQAIHYDDNLNQFQPGSLLAGSGRR